jgi:hypothetical protein
MAKDTQEDVKSHPFAPALAGLDADVRDVYEEAIEEPYEVLWKPDVPAFGDSPTRCLAIRLEKSRSWDFHRTVARLLEPRLPCGAKLARSIGDVVYLFPRDFRRRRRSPIPRDTATENPPGQE